MEPKIQAKPNPASNGAAIRTEELARHYHMGSSVIRAVDGITLEVHAGEFIAFLGASGSGKAINSPARSEEHTSELQSHLNLVCRLLLEKKKNNTQEQLPWST